MYTVMSERIVVTFSDKHSEWLEEMRKKKGLSTIQDVVRLIILNEYEKNMSPSSDVGVLPSESKDGITVQEIKHREEEQI